MAKKHNKSYTVIACTCRVINYDWIRERRLYNLPLPKDGKGENYASVSHIIIYARDLSAIVRVARFSKVVDAKWLATRGYKVSPSPHGERYALFELGNETTEAEVLGNSHSDVYVCSTRWTGKIDANFFSRPLPACDGKSVPNIFERLRPFFGKWHSARVYNPVQMDFLDALHLRENVDVPFPPLKKSKFTFIDLFAGIGGFHLAMHALGGNCVFASEWDRDAQETYRTNYGIEPFGDITRINERDIPPHDVLCAGFPCQPFSKAGKQEGFEDETKGTLFFDIERILKYHHTKYIILENVRNLVAHDNGNTWKTIHGHLVGLGYRLTPEPLIVSPHQFGVPQLRERVVVLGVYDPEHANLPLEITLPKPKAKNECSLDDILEPDNHEPGYELTEQEIDAIDTWNEFYQGIKEKVIGFPIWLDYFKVAPPTDPAEMPEWKQAFVRKNNQLYKNNKKFIDGWLKRHGNLTHLTPTMRKMEWQCGESVKSAWDAFMQFRPSGLRIKRPDCAPALVAIVQVPIVGKYRRRMTVREAARLQSFDDRFIPNQNRHQAYRQFGNAVNVEVIRQCAQSLFHETGANF